MRIAYVVLFCIIFSFMDILLALIALVQCVLSLLSGEPNDSLKDFGSRLGIYLKQISDFVSFNSEEKPYPFSDWPESDLAEDVTKDIANADG
jgi:hypothetical protein